MKIPLRFVALILLVAQTVGAILLMRLSRLRPPSSSPQNAPPLPYLSTTVVTLAEGLKVIGSLAFVFLECDWSFSRMLSSLRADILLKPAETVKVGIPSALYIVQNNLLFIALLHISGPLYQVTYQLKILTTALLSVIVLKRRLTRRKWEALGILTLGVILIQVPQGGATSGTAGGNTLVGITAVLCACVTSAFAGVYLEKLLKDSNVSIWTRNIQLGLYGLVVGLCGVMWSDGAAVMKDGFFQGYTPIVWWIIVVQAVGGLVVAAVLKYADNIVKCFGNALAIGLSCIASYYIVGDFQPTELFVLGSVLVVVATWRYAVEPPKYAEASRSPYEQELEAKRKQLSIHGNP